MPPLALSPPSTGTVTPVTYEAAGEARNQTTSACSRASAQRWAGIRRVMKAENSGSATCPAVRPVTVPPGAIALIRMPWAA